MTDERQRALLESALAASGVLGATLGDDRSARTAAWAVTAAGARATRSLAELVTVDPEHPQAAEAAGILVRIALADTATGAEPGEHLLIGADGSFRAGVLSGRPPDMDQSAALPPAGHVGARQRRRAALARAEALDLQAVELERQAAESAAAAARFAAEAEHLRARARAFPRRDRLSGAEATRAAAAKAATETAETAERSGQRAARLRSAYQAEREAWVARTRARALPADLADLVSIREAGGRAANVLARCATALRDKFAGRLHSALADARAAEEQVQALGRLAAEARTAHQEATTAEAALDELQKLVGAPVERMLNQLATARADRRDAEQDVNEAETTAREREREEVEAEARRASANSVAAEAEPASAASRRALRALLDAPGAATALGLDPHALPDDAGLLGTVQGVLAGRRTYARKTVRERYDTVRAELAGTWALDPGDSHGELDTYVLPHQDQSYAPHAAAERARTLQERAHRALAAAEERALREFVIGRLPRAIGLDWQWLLDWNRQVNRKMRAAAASSGVGVQVRIGVRDDLSPATRTARMTLRPTPTARWSRSRCGLVALGIHPAGWRLPPTAIVTLPPAELAACDWPAPDRSDEWIFVTENPSVLTAAYRHLTSAGAVRLLCTFGTPSTVEAAAIGRLRGAGWQIAARADFDEAGLRHVTALLAAAPGARPWRMTAADYAASVDPLSSLRPSRTDQLHTPWDAALAEAMRRTGIPAFEEGLLPALLGDLVQTAPAIS